MKYQSTRDNYRKVSSSEAVQLGMVPKGGLFVPEEIPCISKKELEEMLNETYQEIAFRVLRNFLTDFSKKTLKEIIFDSYGDNFNAEDIVPVVDLDDEMSLLELWHGPTAAFKDLALQFMPHLLSSVMDRETVILVATSGDTGKAALEGFKDVEGTKIIVFYPEDGVSRMQELQMITTGGRNTAVVALDGNFDDCQSGVKEIFADEEVKGQFDQAFSSANSINWGRLAPQIVYWFSAYSDLCNSEEIDFGEKIDIVVPTGNFGNILSAYYAFRMGLPVDNFVCASNENNILTDFFRTGVYDTSRNFKKTISPAMDILVSSNLERFLFHISNGNAEKVVDWYQNLSNRGKFLIDSEVRESLDEFFYGEYATQNETLETISEVFNDYDYLLDPHTAVGVNCYRKYRKRIDTDRKTLIASTANPFKFAPAVLKALRKEEAEDGVFESLEKLRDITGWEIHRGLRNLEDREVKPYYSGNRENIRGVIAEILSK